MTTDHFTIALNAQELATEAGADGVPEWIHLLPAHQGAILTGGKRGPCHVADADALIAASFAQVDRLPIDENHATDLAAPKGLPAPACGWITEMQARDDGIWGRVEWTAAGRDLVGSKAYRGISPVIFHDKAKQIIAIGRASLINKPNLRGLTVLHAEENTMFQEKIAKALGLDADASEDDIMAAIAALGEGGEKDAALQSQLAEVGAVLGVEEGGDVLAAVKAAAGDGDDTVIAALQAENAELKTDVAAMKEDRARDKAVAFIDGEFGKGRAITSALRDHYVARHMQEPESVEKEIKALPLLGETGLKRDAGEGGLTKSLNAQELADKAGDYQRKQREAGREISISQAVRAIEEGV